LPTDLPETFGRVLKKYRKRKKWSQMKLAMEAGMHLNAQGNLERGKHNPSLQTVFILCRAFKVPVVQTTIGRCA
jgi:transcriptional regulator with XRE-family HTH domain